MRRAHGTPVLIGNKRDTSLQPIAMSEGALEFNESWLQRLVHAHPECLPVGEIEPAFDEIVPVCMEFPTKHGPMDNLMMTADGDLVFVEVKLWRNPEARRKVVAQALDYASCIFEMDYAEFEDAALKGSFGIGPRPARLYDVFASHNPKDEAAFVDAVNANLRRGRALILVVGDGIRSEAARLVSLVQSHAGAHFTFALVELGVFRMPADDSFLVLPRTLAQTEMISRAIVQIDDRRTSVVLPDNASSTQLVRASAENISAEQFYEIMAALNPVLPAKLRAFVEKVEALGVYADFRRSLILRWDPPTGRSVNLGYIMRNGHLYTDATSSNVPKDLAYSYIKEVAAALGLIVTAGQTGQTWNLKSSASVPRIEQLADRLDAWVPVIERFLNTMREKFG